MGWNRHGGGACFPSGTFALGNGNHVSGANVMHVILGPDGHVDEITPVSGPEILRAGVTAAVAQWVYRPHLVDGRAVAVDTTVTVNF